MSYGEEVRERVERALAMPWRNRLTGEVGTSLTRHDRLVAGMCGFLSEQWRAGRVTEPVADHLCRLSEGVDHLAWETACIAAQELCDFDAERAPEDGDVLGRWPLHERR